MMQLDRMALGRRAKEMGFVRDTLEKVCRLADVLKFMGWRWVAFQKSCILFSWEEWILE